LSVVVDASAALSWLLPDEQTPASLRLLEEVARRGAAAPVLLQHEIANALVVARRRGRISEEDIAVIARKFLSLQIDLDVEGVLNALPGAALQATRLGISAYDATYLELAHRLGAELATFDARLAAAARAEGVPLVDLGPLS
jgi:predicted nucleic acid-binding protein